MEVSSGQTGREEAWWSASLLMYRQSSSQAIASLSDISVALGNSCTVWPCSQPFHSLCMFK